jgi:thiamine pyrophosphate-dependent acetolactate synthase large subunit-like protein
MSLYDEDVHAWAVQQAAVLRQLAATGVKKVSDIVHADSIRVLVEELERRYQAARHEAEAAKAAQKMEILAYAIGRAEAYRGALEGIRLHTGIKP